MGGECAFVLICQVTVDLLMVWFVGPRQVVSCGLDSNVIMGVLRGKATC